MEKILSTTLLYGLMLLWPSVVLCQGSQCQATIEEGFPSYPKPNCYNPQANGLIRFQKVLDNEVVDVSTCSVQGKCDNFMPSSYRSSTNVTEEGYRVMYLNITRTTRNDTTFRCSIDVPWGLENSSICLDIFVKPETPVCEPLSLVNSQIITTCRSKKVFPDASLDGKMYQTDLADGLEAEVNCDLSPSSTFPGYKASNCTARFPLSGVKPGTYFFYFEMYPVTTKRTSVPRGAVFPRTYSWDLSAPKVQLSNDCPSELDYIASGSCICMLTTIGSPPGQARWYTQSGQVVGTDNYEDRSATLSVSYNLSGPTPKYECRADTVLNVTSPSKVSFTPKLAYGPLNLTFESSEDGAFDLCPNEKLNTTVTCQVPRKDVAPSVHFTIIENGRTVLDQAQGSIIGETYVQDYSFRPSTGGGKYFIICRAENTISSELFMPKDLTLEVREPPTSAPVLQVHGNNAGSKLANVTLGRQTGITCTVDGGYPQVSQVTIKCGSSSEQAHGNIAFLALEVTQEVDGLICYCSAQHVTGCYNGQSKVELQVKVGSNDDGDQKTNIIIGVSVTAAVVIVVLVVAFVLFYKTRVNKAPGVTKDPKLAVSVISDSMTMTQLSPDDSSNGYITPIDHYDFIAAADENVPTDDSGYCHPIETDDSSNGYITVVDHYDFIADIVRFVAEENAPTDDSIYRHSVETVSDSCITDYDNNVPSNTSI